MQSTHSFSAHTSITCLLTQDQPHSAIVKGLVWLDLNRNGIQDNDEDGVEDALVELHTLVDDSAIDPAKTGNDGEFQFILDEQDFGIEPIGGDDFYIQVYPPKGFLFPLKLQEDITSSDNEESSSSILLNMALGEMYEMDTRLITACDPSLGNVSFDGIKTILAF